MIMHAHITSADAQTGELSGNHTEARRGKHGQTVGEKKLTSQVDWPKKGHVFHH